MKRMHGLVVVGCAVALLLGSVAHGHFQLIYTPDPVVTAARIPLKLVFTHPGDGEHVMNMGAGEDGEAKLPLKFGVMTQRGEEEPVVTDLLDSLSKIEFSGTEGKGIGFETTYQARGMGDFVFFLDPGPYYEEKEEGYIQQVTKVVVNRGGMPTCALEDVPGLSTQIRPLVLPYGLWVGNIFHGQVVVWDAEAGKNVPVPNTEIEVEYLNVPIDMDANAFVGEQKIDYPNKAMETQVIRTNANGEFFYAIPKSGWWGFAALESGGEDLEHNGKPLELGAVMWVYAFDVP